jgi:hypothetical protein
MQPIPNHPYALWSARWEPRLEQVIMNFACTKCGDRTEWHCSRPQLQRYRALQYGALHAHGLRPVVPQASRDPYLFAPMMVAYGPPPPPGGWRENRR